MSAKLYYFRRAKAFSSVATDFGPSTSTQVPNATYLFQGQRSIYSGVEDF